MSLSVSILPCSSSLVRYFSAMCLNISDVSLVTYRPARVFLVRFTLSQKAMQVCSGSARSSGLWSAKGSAVLAVTCLLSAASDPSIMAVCSGVMCLMPSALASALALARSSAKLALAPLFCSSFFPPFSSSSSFSPSSFSPSGTSISLRSLMAFSNSGEATCCGLMVRIITL